MTARNDFADLTRQAKLVELLLPRQRELLERLGHCELRRQIADAMKICPLTVDRDCQELYVRLGIPNKALAVRLAGFLGWV
jgi:DNA-binding NarL/FixJ family response regulator